MKAAIYSRVMEEAQLQEVQLFFNELENQKIEPVIYKEYFEQIRGKLTLPANSSTFEHAEDLGPEVEFIISLGGDGTLLDTVGFIRGKDIAVMGINFGRLGFLASIGHEDLRSAVKAIAKRTYVVDKRTLIHLDANIPMFGNVPYALNEFAIHKRDVASMIKIHTYINGELLNTYWSDGLIVSTPTGSTGTRSVVMVRSYFRIQPASSLHPLHRITSMCGPSWSRIIRSSPLRSKGRADQIICALDSRRELVDKTVQLAVRKESFCVKLVRLSENNFLQTLRNKLTWGLDKRN